MFLCTIPKDKHDKQQHIVVRFEKVDAVRPDFSAYTFNKYAVLVYKGIESNGIDSIQALIDRVESVRALVDKAMTCATQGKRLRKTKISISVRHITHKIRVCTVRDELTIVYRIKGIDVVSNVTNIFDQCTHKCVFAINNKLDILYQNNIAKHMFGDWINIYTNDIRGISGIDLINSIFVEEQPSYIIDLANAILNSTYPRQQKKIAKLNTCVENTLSHDGENYITESITRTNTVISVMSQENYISDIFAIISLYPINGNCSLLVIKQVDQKRAIYKHLAKSSINVMSSILPLHVIKYIMDGKDMNNISSLTQSHDNVSILFTDIIGWTTTCDKLDPKLSFAFLNELYNTYDDLASRFDIYKLETVGDCYVAVSGLMQTKEDGIVEILDNQDAYTNVSVSNIVAFAKALLKNVKKINGPCGGSPIDIRIGIHVGRVNSGVLGYKMPKFVLAGDAMNVASRLEQSCSPNSIHASKEVINRLNVDTHEFVLQNSIEIKGKGTMDTYIYTCR